MYRTNGNLNCRHKNSYRAVSHLDPNGKNETLCISTKSLRPQESLSPGHRSKCRYPVTFCLSLMTSCRVFPVALCALLLFWPGLLQARCPGF